MGKARLLIVEDDIDIANMLRIYFTSQNYSVDIAHRGSLLKRGRDYLQPTELSLKGLWTRV